MPTPRRAVALVAAVLLFAVTGCTGGHSRTPGPAALPSAANPTAKPDHTCSWKPSSDDAPVGVPATLVPSSGIATLVMTTNLGEIDIRMDRARTPCTVASLAFLAQAGYFAGGPCHRLTTTGIFVLQCGRSVSGAATAGYTTPDEALPHLRYADAKTSLGPGCNKAGDHCSGGPVPHDGPICAVTDPATVCQSYTNSLVRYPRGLVALANTGQRDSNGGQFFINWKDTSLLTPTYSPFGVVTKGMAIVDRVATAGSDPADDGTPRLTITIESAKVSG